MSHFAVYALTRNVGIDIVPPAPLSPRVHSPGIPGAIFLPLPHPREFLISRNSYEPVALSRRVGMPSAYILAAVYSVRLSRRTIDHASSSISDQGFRANPCRTSYVHYFLTIRGEPHRRRRDNTRLKYGGTAARRGEADYIVKLERAILVDSAGRKDTLSRQDVGFILSPESAE